jgi:hypothetical protein
MNGAEAGRERTQDRKPGKHGPKRIQAALPGCWRLRVFDPTIPVAGRVDIVVTRTLRLGESSEENGISINPFARSGRASGSRALQAHPASCPWSLENEYLPPRDRFVTAGAPPLVVERMPEPEFVDVAENIEFVFR